MDPATYSNLKGMLEDLLTDTLDSVEIQNVLENLPEGDIPLFQPELSSMLKRPIMEHNKVCMCVCLHRISVFSKDDCLLSPC